MTIAPPLATPDSGSAPLPPGPGTPNTRELAATEAIDSVLAHWARKHPRTGGAELVTICVDDTEAHAGPALDPDGTYDPHSITTTLHYLRDHLATDPW